MSRLAEALATALQANPETFSATPKQMIMDVIDARLVETRKHYLPEELASCPIVSCHHQPCTFCITAAMRDFIV